MKIEKRQSQIPDNIIHLISQWIENNEFYLYEKQQTGFPISKFNIASYPNRLIQYNDKIKAYKKWKLAKITSSLGVIILVHYDVPKLTYHFCMGPEARIGDKTTK